MDPNVNRPRRSADLSRYYSGSQPSHHRHSQSYHTNNSQPIPPKSRWSNDFIWQQPYVRLHNSSWRAPLPNSNGVSLLEHCPPKKSRERQNFYEFSKLSGRSHSKNSTNSDTDHLIQEKNVMSTSRPTYSGEFSNREASSSSRRPNPKSNTKHKDLDKNKTNSCSASTAALADKVKASLKLLKCSKTNRDSANEKEIPLPVDVAQNKGDLLCSTNPLRLKNSSLIASEQVRLGSVPNKGGYAWDNRQTFSSDVDPNKLLEGIGFIQNTVSDVSNTVQGATENIAEDVDDCNGEQLSPDSTESVSSEKLAVFKQKELTNILLMDKVKRKQHLEQPTNTSKIIMEHLVRENLNAQSRQLSHIRFRINPDEHSLYNELIEMEELVDMEGIPLPVREPQQMEEDIQILALPPKEVPLCIELDNEENLKEPILSSSVAANSQPRNEIVNENVAPEVSRIVVSSETLPTTPSLDTLLDPSNNSGFKTPSLTTKNETSTFEVGTQTDSELISLNPLSSHVGLPDLTTGSNRITFFEWLKEEERIWNEIRSIDVCIKELMDKRDVLIQKMADKKCQFLCSLTPCTGAADVETVDVAASNQIPEMIESPESIASPEDGDQPHNSGDTVTTVTEGDDNEEEEVRNESAPTSQMANLIEKLRENGINVAVGNTVITIDLAKKDKTDNIVSSELPSETSMPEEKRKKKDDSNKNEKKRVKLDPDSTLESAVNTTAEQVIDSSVPLHSKQVTDTNTEPIADHTKQVESSLPHAENRNSTIGTMKYLEFHQKAVCCMHVQGPCLITAAEDKTVHVYDLKTGEVLLRVLGHQMPVTGLYTISFSESLGAFRKSVSTTEYLQHVDLITASLDGCVRQISLSTSKLVREMNCQHPINCLGFSKQHGNIILLGSSVGFIYLYKPKQAVMKLANFQAENEILRLHMCRLLATKVVVIAARRSPLAVRDFHTGILLLTLSNHVAVNSVYCITVLGDFVYSGDSARNLIVYDTANSGKVVDSIRMPAAIVDAYQDGRYIYLACKDGVIRIYDSKKKCFISTVTCPPMGPLTCMQMKGNKKIFCGSVKGEVALIPFPEIQSSIRNN